MLTTDNPHDADALADGGRANILHNYAKGREMALAGGYDAVLIVESDVVPPPDALDRLAALLAPEKEGGRGADVAYGLYVFRPKGAHGGRSVNVFARLHPRPGGCRNIGSPLTAHPGRYEAALREGVVPCSGGGLGIVLAKRAVFEAVPFRSEGPTGNHSDAYWNADVWRAGFEQWADLAVVCGHKTPEGDVLWPPLTQPRTRPF